MADQLGRALEEASKIIWDEYGDCPHEIDEALEAWRSAGDGSVPSDTCPHCGSLKVGQQPQTLLSYCLRCAKAWKKP